QHTLRRESRSSSNPSPGTNSLISILGRERALASTRLVIESVFANLKGQMRLEQHLTKTPAGLAVRIAQRILALTIGILLNSSMRNRRRFMSAPIVRISSDPTEGRWRAPPCTGRYIMLLSLAAGTLRQGRVLAGARILVAA